MTLSVAISLIIYVSVAIGFIVSAQISLTWTLAGSIILLIGMIWFLWRAGARRAQQSK